MADSRGMAMGINGSVNDDGLQNSLNINKSGDEYIPVDEMYPEAAEQEIPQQQKALVPVNKRPRKVPPGQRGGQGGGPRMMPQQQQQQMYMNPQGMNQVQQFNQYPMQGQNNGQMMMFQGGPQGGQNMQLVPVANNQVGQMMPFEPQEKKKKWSLTEWEDKRMRHASGRMCVNVLYCLTTLLMIIMFISLFTDIWKSYQKLTDEYAIRIQQAKVDFDRDCKDYPDNKMSYDGCKAADDLRNQTASNQVTFGSAVTSYTQTMFNDFAEGLAWKTIGIITLLLCLCACGSSCSKFMKNMANDPTQFQRAQAQRRRRDSDDKKKKKKKDSSSSSDDEEKKAKKKRKKQQKAIKYGHPFHDGHAIEYQNMSADGLDPQYAQYGGRPPLQGPQHNNYNALPQYEGQGAGRPPQFPLPIDMQQANGQRRPPQARNAPLMLDNGQGRAQPRRQNPNGMMRMTKETTQQVRGPNGQMMTKRTQQVVEQHMDDKSNPIDEEQYENNMGFNEDSMNQEQQYQEQERLVADKTYDVEDKSDI